MPGWCLCVGVAEWGVGTVGIGNGSYVSVCRVVSRKGGWDDVASRSKSEDDGHLLCRYTRQRQKIRARSAPSASADSRWGKFIISF